MEAHVVASPGLAELRAARGELADQVAEGAIVRFACGGRPQGGGDIASNAVPVTVEVVRARVEEDEAREVRAFLPVEQFGEQRAAQRVGRKDVVALVEQQSGGAGDRVEHVLHAGPDALARRPAPRCGGRGLRGAGEVEQV